MALPVSNIIFPSILAGYANGLLPSGILYPVAGGYLTRNASISFNAMNQQATAAGYPLTASNSANTYRNLGTQESYWYDRYDHVPRNTDSAFYKGRQWWRKYSATTAAVPGTSNHGWGLAIDIQNCSGGRLNWLLANAYRFGFSWEIQSEPWHLRYILGDDLPPGLDIIPLPEPIVVNPPETPPSIIEELDMSTTTSLPMRRPNTPDDNPVLDFTWLRAHGEDVGKNHEVISQLFIRQLVRDTPPRDKVITVWFAGHPVPVLLSKDGLTAIVDVQHSGLCSIGDFTGAFGSEAAVGVYAEARETIVPK